MTRRANHRVDVETQISAWRAKGESIDRLAGEIRACRLCAEDFSHAPRPILQTGGRARIAIFGQAPGNLAHQEGRPFTDPSGVRLRSWLGVDEATFYNSEAFAIVPMAFCFPGYDAAGSDLPPPKRCAATWRARVMAALPQLELAILVGAYAQKWHLGERAKRTMTETVAAWREYAPVFAPTPHPSWRNNAWLKKNPWFEADLLPEIRARVAMLSAR
ncbi:MAG: uracil-DNA glycosylase family protein [Pseudomonadota bacterium]